MDDLFPELIEFSLSLMPGQQKQFVKLIDRVRSEAVTAPVQAFKTLVDNAVIHHRLPHLKPPVEDTAIVDYERGNQ